MSNSPPTAAPPKEWMPRFWQGCNFQAWLRLLVRNRFAVAPRYWYIAAVVTVVSALHSAVRLFQDVLLGSRPGRTPILHHPLFIIGHWRTGTTLLHELLILDPRHSFPTTYDCLEPNHFLLTEQLVTRWLRFLVPSHRPMDNMAAGWDKPQEDEFALCMLGQPSPYLTIAFPNHPPQDQEALDLERLTPAARAGWKKAFLRFLRELTWKDPRRLILKSPTHSCRVRTLLELFPQARFVHIVRDPFVVFPSTVNLWKTLYEAHGLQVPTFAGLEEQVLATFAHLYAKIEEAKRLIPPGQFHELRYEDLIRDPVGQMHLLYQNLGLGEFDRIQPLLERYLVEHAGYRTNRYPQLSEETRSRIRQNWGAVIERYGYGG
jgi:hypothetical protein